MENVLNRFNIKFINNDPEKLLKMIDNRIFKMRIRFQINYV